MAARVRLARLLVRTGVADAVLRARAAVRVPRLTVLTYHHVAEPGPDYEFDPGVADVTPAQFERHLDALARRFTVIGVDELCRALDGGALPPNPAMITFDDAYRSCIEVALPALAARGLRAVFFASTSFVEERRLFWWERLAWLLGQARRRGVERLALSYPVVRVLDVAPPTLHELIQVVKNTRGLDVDRFLDDVTAAAGVAWSRDVERELTDRLLMTWDQLRALLDAGMDVESHTRRHRVLQTLDPDQLDDELRGARADLERRLGRAPRAIAYPVGRPIAGDPVIRRAVLAAGYRVGFTNGSGSSWVHGRLDPLDVGRFAMDRELPDALFLGQLAFPRLGYMAPPNPPRYTAA